MSDRSSRSSRDRDDEPRGRDRSSRDDSPRRSSRDEPEERPRRGSRDDNDDDRPSRGGRSSSSRGSSYEYQARSADGVRDRANKGGNDYDKLLIDGVKMWKPNDGDNRIRILPPTWAKAKHFGLDIFVHYGVGADRGQYLCLHKMKGEADPIHEEYVHAKATLDADNKDDRKYIKDLEAKRRVLIYLIDRDHEKEGVQCWAMPWTVDRDIVKVSVDKSNGEVLPIDHPEEGYDVEFTKSGQKDRTEYTGVAIARSSSPLGRDEWLDHAMDHPLPDQLRYFEYEHIAKAFGGAGAHKEKSRGRDDDRDSDRGGRDRDRDSRDRDDPPPRGRGRAEPEKNEEPTWDDIHAMTGRELEDLVDQEKLDIDPKDAKDDDDLADWICEEMKISKPAKTPRRVVAKDDGDDTEDRLARMRNRRD